MIGYSWTHLNFARIAYSDPDFGGFCTSKHRHPRQKSHMLEWASKEDMHPKTHDMRHAKSVFAYASRILFVYVLSLRVTDPSDIIFTEHSAARFTCRLLKQRIQPRVPHKWQHLRRPVDDSQPLRLSSRVPRRALQYLPHTHLQPRHLPPPLQLRIIARIWY